MLEIVSVIFTLICVYLTAKQNILCWSFGLIGITGFFILFLKQELYFQTSLQVLFFIQSLFGLYIWNKDKKLKVSTLPKVKLFTHLLISICLPIYIVSNYMENNLTNMLDALSTSLSILATIYLIFKKIEAWIIWMIVNIIIMSLMINQELYFVVLLEIILFTISLNAFLLWGKDLKRIKYEEI